MIGLKVLFRKSSGRVLGAQALGDDGPAVDKRISALAMAIRMGATIYDLEEAELRYSPQFGSAKDAVNFAGMVAADVLHGDMPLAHWEDTQGAFLLDVRQPVELAVESVPGAISIPLGELCGRLGEIPASARSSSSAAPPSAPAWRRASCCRTGSKRETSLAACSRERCSRSRRPMPSHRPRPESFDATLDNLSEPVIAVDCGAVPVAIRAGTLWAVLVAAFIAWIVRGWVNAVRGVARTAPLTYLMPPVAGLVAWLAMGESCTWIKLAGAAVTLAGVALAQFGRRG